jgi:uncharacterized protein (DUF302 family)
MRPLLLALLLLLPSAALADDELITVQSAHSAPVTVQRLQEAIIANGWTILGTTDHAALAAEFGVKIPARTTIAYVLMAGWVKQLIEAPTIALEVPTRVLVWEDKEGVWVTRDTERNWLRNVAGRHGYKPIIGGVRVMSEQIAVMIEKVTH